MSKHRISLIISSILYVLDSFCLLTILNIESFNPSHENLLAFKKSRFKKKILLIIKLLFS